MPGPSSTGLVLTLLILLVVLVSDAWVYVDAKAHQERGTPVFFSAGTFAVDTPATWFLACLLLWIFFFPLYIISRRGEA